MTTNAEPPRHTLYVPDAGHRTMGEVVHLAEDERRHLKTLRLTGGDAVRLTDGRGALWVGRVQPGGPPAVRLEERLPAPPALGLALWIAVGNKQATLWLIEKAAEFGVRRIQPVEFARSASVADAGRSRSFWAKAGRRALAAVKQSGGGWLPHIEDPLPFPDALRGASGGTRILLAAGSPPLLCELAGWDGDEPLLVVVGPEGGLTGEEAAACAGAGFRTAGLGPTVLRFETAGVAAAAVVAQLRLMRTTTREV